MSKFTRDILNSLFPEGVAWEPKVSGDLDNYLTGQSDNIEPVFLFLKGLSEIRNPLTTPLLEELEREYGISKNDSLTEADRRAFLQSFVFGSEGNGRLPDVERRLQEAGFDVFVYANDPAQNPQVLLNEQFKMVAGGFNAYAGREDAFAKRKGGELIVNGDKFKQTPDWLSVAGGTNAFAGNTSFNAGKFDALVTEKIEYPVPTNPKDWPLLFFVGGAVTRDIDDKIIKIENVIQPAEKREQFLKILLRYKPLHTWCISLVDFV